MDFIIYNLLLSVVCYPAYLIFRLGELSPLILTPLFGRSEKPPKVAIFSLFGLAGLYLIYVSGMWPALCIAITYKYINKAEVTSDWLYFIVGFFWCFLLFLCWTKNRKRRLKRSLQGDLSDEAMMIRAFSIGVVIIAGIVVVVAYMSFAMWPRLMNIPYGWILDLAPLDMLELFVKKNWWWMLLVIFLLIILKIILFIRAELLQRTKSNNSFNPTPR